VHITNLRKSGFSSQRRRRLYALVASRLWLQDLVVIRQQTTELTTRFLPSIVIPERMSHIITLERRIVGILSLLFFRMFHWLYVHRRSLQMMRVSATPVHSDPVVYILCLFLFTAAFSSFKILWKDQSYY